MARHLIPADATIRNIKPKEAPFRLNDGDGLYLLVKPNGARWWRFDYSIEIYPDTRLSAARARADEARRLVAAGTDPSEARKIRQAKERESERRIAEGLPPADFFKDVAREWFAKYSATWAPSHGEKIIRRLERYISMDR
ncbi:MAG: integrase arm-type DNA-binding domain-containing protein [Gammaproteobacteria bacterium]